MNINDVLLKVKQIANKQDKSDNRLLTVSKEIVGQLMKISRPWKKGRLN